MRERHESGFPEREDEQFRGERFGRENDALFGPRELDRRRRELEHPDPQRGPEWRDRAPDWAQPRFAGDSVGAHVGKGPKGYQRADDRILEDANHALERDPHVDASEIEVSCQKGELVLKGTVATRDAKRRAEQCVEDLAGVKDVRNEIRLQSAEQR